MRKCWREDPEERPTFLQLSSIVERLLTAIAGYTELGMVLVDTSQEEEEHSKSVFCRFTVTLLAVSLYKIVMECTIIPGVLVQLDSDCTFIVLYAIYFEFIV